MAVAGGKRCSDILDKDYFRQLCIGSSIRPQAAKSKIEESSSQGVKRDITRVEGSETGPSNEKKIAGESTDEMDEIIARRYRREYCIHVTGFNPPHPIYSFEEIKSVYEINERVVLNVRDSEYYHPTPIQSQVIPSMLLGRDVNAFAPTGSGKTVAFIVPVLGKLMETRVPNEHRVRAIILEPTRELVHQTYYEGMRLAQDLDLRLLALVKNCETRDELKTFVRSFKNYDIIISTPNLLATILAKFRKNLYMQEVDWLIIDESDRLFAGGFKGFGPQVKKIHQMCSKERVHTSLFSATYSYEVDGWSMSNLKDVLTISIGMRNTTAQTVDQSLVFCGTEDGKLFHLQNIITKGIKPPVLVFVHTKERAKELFAELLSYENLTVDVIHSDKTPKQRDIVVRCFREGKIALLICTDLLGRGMDFRCVNLVINYDIPQEASHYIHRVGRTGRAGQKGSAITFFTEEDKPFLPMVAHIMKNAGCELPEYLKQLKKPKKKDQRRLATLATYRDPITSFSLDTDSEEDSDD